MRKRSSRVTEPFAVLPDQNVPYSVLRWLTNLRPAWRVVHATDVGLAIEADSTVFRWAQDHRAAVVTFDEDFADRRSFPVGDHYGIVRLRVWPTTAEETIAALQRLLEQVSEDELRGALVIVGRSRIRIRPRHSNP